MKNALIVRGGWEGHDPVATSDRYADFLTSQGYTVTLSSTLDSYLGDLSSVDLIVQCWSMGSITSAQLSGLVDVVRAGTGFAGWHGGVVDAFRDQPGYHLMTGGQFIHHHKDFVRYEVRPSGWLADLGPFEVESEQYYVHADPGNEVLAETTYVEDPGLWGAPVMPVTWTRRHGAGRVFVTTIGHRLADLEVPQVHEMITRGLVWATR